MKKINTKNKKDLKGKAKRTVVEKLSDIFEAGNIEAFIEVRKQPAKLLYWNFIIGLSRGIGFLLGATVVGALLIALLKHTLHKLGGAPWIGEQLAQIYHFMGESITDTAKTIGH